MSTERKQRPVRPIPDALPSAETIALERPWFTRVGILAFVVGILPVIGVLLQSSASSAVDTDIGQIKSVAESLTVFANGQGGTGLVGGQTDIARTLGSHSTAIIASGVLSGVALSLTGPVLFFLVRAAWRRRPAFPRWFFWLPLLGGVLFGVGTAIATIYQAVQLHDFTQLAVAAQNNASANDALLSARDNLTAVRFITVIGQLFLTVGLGSAALGAMNVGLISRVLGIIGIFLAALVLLPLIPPTQQDFLRAFWFVALGLTILGRWPGGRPQAWDSGEPRPWPTRAQMVEAAERAREAQAVVVVDDAPAPRPKASGGGRRRRK